MNQKPSIVLVHGAWADGSSWSAVIESLQADGYSVTAPQFPETSLADDVARLQRVREVLPSVVDPREAWPGEELVAEHLFPQRVDGLQLREEPVAAQIEAVTLELDRLGQPADDAVRLEDGCLNAALGEHVGGGQSGRAGAEDDGSGRRRSGVVQALTQASKCTPRPGRPPQLM